MTPTDWKLRLERFFHDRGAGIAGVPTLFDHCMVSAKDARVSARPEVHADVIASIVKALALTEASTVLEVGCASGYIACGLAPRVAHYSGVDLAAGPLEVARKMKLANAVFEKADGGKLPFESRRFDAALVYDVYTNFPDFDDGVPLMQEVLRVVKPGGRVLVGSVTNKKLATQFEARAQTVARDLEAEFGPLPVPSAAPEQSGFLARLQRGLSAKVAPDVKPEIVVYYFDSDDFASFAAQEGVGIALSDVHAMNPYFGFRYNVVFTKPKS